MAKNDLSAFQRKPAATVLATRPDAPKAKGGAPKKPLKEKVSKRTQTMLTEAEFAKLDSERGGVPMSAFIRQRMKEEGIL